MSLIQEIPITNMIILDMLVLALFWDACQTVRSGLGLFSHAQMIFTTDIGTGIELYLNCIAKRNTCEW